MRRSIAAACGAVAATLAVTAGAGGAHAEYWPTNYFLQQTPDDQRVYIMGVIDMYEHVRREVAPDPDDALLRCVQARNDPDRIEGIREDFVNWLLEDPAAWRIHPAELFIEAMADICAR